MNILNFIRDYADAHAKAVDYTAAGLCLLCLVSVLIMEIVDLRRKQNTARLEAGTERVKTDARRTRRAF